MRPTTLPPNMPPPGPAQYGALLAQLHATSSGQVPAAPGMPADAWVGTPSLVPVVAPAAQPLSWNPLDLFARLRSFLSGLLNPAPAQPAGGEGPLLRRGAHGEPIRALQGRLRELGFDPGGVDGDFGPRTEAAVLAFQRSRGLFADGVVGPETWRHLGITVRGDVTFGSPGVGAPVPISGAPSEVAQRFIDSAKQFLGIPYLYGGGHNGYMSKPGRVDCSGLVLQAAHMAGFNLDGSAAHQQRMGREVSMRELQPGDLVFRGRPASHVGIYLGNGQVIHAPRTGDVVKITSVSSFENARRVIG